MDFYELGYLGLFLICLLAATIIPLASEGVLLVYLATGYDPFLCLIFATAGNAIGGLTNYWIGMIGKPESLKKRFKNPERYNRIVQYIKRYGYWLGLLSWTPFLGDPLTIALGFFRVRFVPFLLLMVFGKFMRYFVIIYFWNG